MVFLHLFFHFPGVYLRLLNITHLTTVPPVIKTFIYNFCGKYDHRFDGSLSRGHNDITRVVH